MKNDQGPILEFRDETQTHACLKEWQKRLFLDDWIIKVEVKPLEEMSDKDHIGENDYQFVLKSSIISIGRFGDREGINKMPHELTLVHELLHLKFVFADGVKDTTEGAFFGAHEHMLIEQMAKSLIMAKYDLPFSWFENF